MTAGNLGPELDSLISFHPNKIGCYIYNNKVFLKKKDLFKEIRGNPNQFHSVRFWFNDLIYSKYNWKVEPEESLDELYRRRAQDLRDKYDYLILMFSGGSDSNQVLRSFIDNGIHLDEVRTSTLSTLEDQVERDPNPDGYHIGRIQEFREAALPRLRKLAISHPQIKIKVLDVTDFITQNCQSDNFFQDNNEAFSLYTDYWGIKGNYEILEANKTADIIGGRVGVIYGNDKPFLFKSGNKLYTSFNDVSLNFALTDDHHGLVDRLSFFWSENPDIVCKQAHTFKKALTENNALRTIFNLNRFHTEMPVLERLIYPSTYEPQYFQYEIKNRDDDILSFFFRNKQKDFADSIMKEIRHPMNVKVRGVMVRDGMSCRVQSKYYEIADLS